MDSRKIQTYQNKAKNLCTIYFVFDLDGEFFIAATLFGWIGGDFVYRKVSAKNIFL